MKLTKSTSLEEIMNHAKERAIDISLNINDAGNLELIYSGWELDTDQGFILLKDTPEQAKDSFTVPPLYY